ncbi:MAG: Holliday junction resolvase RuvX [Pseudomonadales bacterium]|nr:Holliday junction resolvase RuvX [Candidatus Woesebacteria bacterium]MCB9801695.1 Holliday junction resolvase RuvX [Pseudomonadales bacterium]
MQKTLAIDYGTKRVGVAVSRGTLAEPLLVVPNDDRVFITLLEVLAEHQIEQIVVGLSESAMAVKTKEFAAVLAKKTTVPIVFADETLSSQKVKAQLRFSKQSKRQGPIDHYAAAEFLGEWLDAQSPR